MTLAQRQAEFLEAQRSCKNTLQACRQFGIGRSTVGRWRTDRKFRRLHDQILAGQPTEAPDSEPVDVIEFVCGEGYLNKRAEIRPIVLGALRQFYAGDYHTGLFAGAIGVGKTYALQLIFLYELYLLSTMPDPHKEFNLDRDTKIILAIQSRTEKLAQGNDFSTIREMILKSKYFRDCFPPIKKPTRDRIEFRNNVAIWAESGDFRAILGMNPYVSAMDEMNFMAISADSNKAIDGDVFDQAKSMYTVAKSRQQSRFYLHGKQRSKILLASSAHYRGAFTDVIEAEAKTDKQIFVWKKAIWESRPDHYSEETFAVFVGSESKDPFIVTEDNEVSGEDRHLVIHAPTDFLPNARRDIYKFLMDDAGVAVQPASTFFENKEVLAKRFTVNSILSRPAIISGDIVQILRDNIIQRDSPRFVHLDLSKTKDATGLAIGHISHFGKIDRGETSEVLPFIYIDAVLQIRPPRYGEISYAKIRELLYTLRDYIPIVRVTADQALSADMLQQLAMKGFSVGLQSVDRTLDPFACLKDCVADKRIALPKHEILLRELTQLQIDWRRGKVDHRVNGSKDVSDAVAGVVYGLTQNKMLRIESGMAEHLLPQLRSVVTPIRSGGCQNELDRYGASSDLFVRAMNGLSLR